MARDNKIIEYRNAEIIKYYNWASSKKLKEWQIYKHLRKTFFLTNRTLDFIISGEWEKAKARKQPQNNPNQLTILDEIERQTNGATKSPGNISRKPATVKQ